MNDGIKASPARLWGNEQETERRRRRWGEGRRRWRRENTLIDDDLKTLEMVWSSHL